MGRGASLGSLAPGYLHIGGKGWREPLHTQNGANWAGRAGLERSVCGRETANTLLRERCGRPFGHTQYMAGRFWIALSFYGFTPEMLKAAQANIDLGQFSEELTEAETSEDGNH